MLTKNTYSKYAKSGIDISGVLVNKPCELVAIKATSGGGASVWNIYDSAVGAEGEPVWVMDSSTTYDDHDSFSHPLRFYRGIYAQIVQGVGFNSQVFIAVIV